MPIEITLFIVFLFVGIPAIVGYLIFLEKKKKETLILTIIILKNKKKRER